ncbi:MAG: exosortase H [Comamonadaceae bacterium]|nr:MAG: exosortase H [Comamonadaceae bacterium]
MLRFLLTFTGVLLALFVAQLTPPAQQYLIVPFTGVLAQASAALAGLFDPEVVASGKLLLNSRTGQGVIIEAGCNGVEACIILVAALLAYPASWRARGVGLVAGMAAIQGVNLLRIISLFYLSQWNMQVFEFSHLYLWQALIMLDVVAVWLLWMRWAARGSYRREALAGAA